MPSVTRPYRFRPVTGEDLPLLARWVTTPAVREWWIEADGSPAPPYDETILSDPEVSLWLVSHMAENGGAPFAFIQDYDPHAHPGHHFAHLPPGSRGIDQFIGVPAMLGRGHGPAFIAAHCESLARRGAPAIGTDPHPTNARAIRAYGKAGFVAGAKVDTAWGPALLMEKRI